MESEARYDHPHRREQRAGKPGGDSIAGDYHPQDAQGDDHAGQMGFVQMLKGEEQAPKKPMSSFFQTKHPV